MPKRENSNCLKKAVQALIAHPDRIKILLGIFLVLSFTPSFSQVAINGNDTLLKVNALGSDSLTLSRNSGKDAKSGTGLLKSVKKTLQVGVKGIKDLVIGTASRRKLDSSSASKIHDPLSNKDSGTRDHLLNIDSTKKASVLQSLQRRLTVPNYKQNFGECSVQSPFLKVTSGYLAYDFMYRSHSDTPFVEPNIASHQLSGQANVLIKGLLPLVVVGRFRKSNSLFYRDLASVQISFDPVGYRNLAKTGSGTHVTFRRADFKDSLFKHMSSDVSGKIDELKSMIKNPFSLQKLIQANEILNVPAKSYVPGLSDSANKARLDSSQAEARNFVQRYKSANEKIDSLTALQDSLQESYALLHRLINRYGRLSGQQKTNSDEKQLISDSLRKMGVYADENETRGSWMTSIRRLSLGKAYVDYTDLTARNISLTGVNFEYNSPFYFAVAAGMVDYRFNDVLVSRSHGARQYLYMVRAGLGKLEANHLIFSFYRGQKELFSAVDTARNNALKISGVSVEARVNLTPDTYFVGEVAKSNVPYYYHDTSGNHSFFRFKDQPNNAYSLRLVGKIPYTEGSYEAMYRFTGAAFQSFNTYQSSSAMKSWYVKANEYFWDRRLRLSASVRSNDFSNPYVQENYNSTTVFKSVSVLFRTKHFPSIQIGYMPMSQLTSINHTIVENRFQSLTITANHFYKLGTSYSNSSLSFSRFYNKPADSSFVFANATNVFFEQRFMFKDFTAAINFNRASSPQYELNVIGEDFDIPLKDKTSIGFSLKLNQFNRTEAKVGEAIRFNHQVGKMDYISLSMDFGYLPSASQRLIPADLGTLQFIKRF